MVVQEHSSPLRVLLVEDSMLAAEHIGDAFAEIPLTMKVKLAQTQDEAVKIAEQFNPEIVVVDLRLKEGTGFGVLRAIAAQNTKRLVIVMTNYAIPNYRHYAKLVGADYFLDKSLDIPQLKSIIESFARSRTENAN